MRTGSQIQTCRPISLAVFQRCMVAINNLNLGWQKNILIMWSVGEMNTDVTLKSMTITKIKNSNNKNIICLLLSLGSMYLVQIISDLFSRIGLVLVSLFYRWWKNELWNDSITKATKLVSSRAWVKTVVYPTPKLRLFPQCHPVCPEDALGA